MIKIMSAIFMAAAAVTACEVEPIVDECNDIQTTVSFSAEEVETKTVFGDPVSSKLPVLWTTNQQVRIFPSTFANAINAPVTPSSDQKTAKFSGEFTFSSTAMSAFYLLSPAAAFKEHVSGTTIKIWLPDTQASTELSPDEKAQILVAKTKQYRPVPATIKFSPTHFTAYMALTFKNIPSSIGKVQGVTVTSAKAPLCGYATYNFADGTTTYPSTSNSVTARLLSANGICWIACFPAQVSGTKLTVTVLGATGSVHKVITVPEGKNLTAGTVSSMTIDMDQTVAVTGVSLNKTSLTLNKGKTEQLTATVSPSNATDKSVTWSSSNTSVATVSSSGLVTGVAPGSAVITVTTNDGVKKATCNVSVVNPVTKVEFRVRVQRTQTDYQYDVDDDEFHMCYGSSTTMPYIVYYADGTSTSGSGATLSVVSGTGVTVTNGTSSVQCNAAGKTAVVRLTSNQDSSIYTDMTIRTWDKPTSVTVKQASSVEQGYQKEGTTGTLYVTISPSTARQKAVIFSQSSNGQWTVTRQSNLQFSVTAPLIDNKWLKNYTEKALNLTIISQTGNPQVNVTITPTNLDLSLPKPFDYVLYNSSSKTYQIWDGGVRILVEDPYGHFGMVSESVSYVAQTGYVPVGIVTYYDADKNIPNEAVVGSDRPTLQSCSRTRDNKTLNNNKYFHGIAIGLNDCADTYWSANSTDVMASIHWNTDLPADLGAYNKMNPFNLTVVGAYYNGVPGLGSANVIYPVDRVWRYPDPGYEYTVNAWPGSEQPNFVMRPWVVPDCETITMFYGDKDELMSSSFVVKLNEQLAKVGGTAIFQSSSDAYWLINIYSNSSSYVIKNSGGGTASKSSVHKLRPFMVF